MRRFTAIALLAATASLVAASAAASPQRRFRTVPTDVGLRIRIAPGLHPIRQRLTPLLDPHLQYAVASYAVRPGSHTCVCDTPNLGRFPRDGAVLFVWERLDVSRRALRRSRIYPPRPARFRLRSLTAQRSECQGPSDEIFFQDHGRAFEADFYVGLATSRRLRHALLATLESLAVRRAPRVM